MYILFIRQKMHDEMFLWNMKYVGTIFRSSKKSCYILFQRGCLASLLYEEIYYKCYKKPDIS